MERKIYNTIFEQTEEAREEAPEAKVSVSNSKRVCNLLWILMRSSQLKTS